MTISPRTLLQQALDALDRAISDDRAYIRECKDAAEAIRAHLAAQPAPVPLTDTETHAELWKLAVRKGLITVRSELIDPRNHGTRVSWMQGHDKACDISNDAAAHGIAASPAAPAAPAAPVVLPTGGVLGLVETHPSYVAGFKAGHAAGRKGSEFAAPVVREPVIDEMDAIASKYAHKLALDLECVLLDYHGKWWNTAMQTLGEYRSAMNAIHERESPTHMGEPVLPRKNCDRPDCPAGGYGPCAPCEREHSGG